MIREYGLLWLMGILTACIIVAGGLWSAERSATNALASVPAAVTAEYGRYLLRETPEYIGPDHENPELRYSGNHLACASCHLDIGERPGALSLLQTSTRYPRDSGRDGGIRDLRDRINGCMERSMNGRKMPRDSVEMVAMESYILRLGDQYAAMSESRRSPIEPPGFAEPDRAANPEAGRLVYEDRCNICHSADGSGQMATANPSDGYVFPPLWGPDSFNNGAGMTRVLTAARFIKARMPFGQPDLSNDQAYDVAAYINSHTRPVKPNLEADFPDISRKPIDSPYPPYADDFPHEQHKLGPFKPIRDYYETLREAP